MQDRRNHSRINGPFDGSYHGASGRRNARIVDLSVGGCFVDVMAQAKTGEPVTVTVTVAGDTLELEGEVVYPDKVQGFAVAFGLNPPEVLRRLKRALER